MKIRFAIIVSAIVIYCSGRPWGFAIETGEIAPPLELSRLDDNRVIRLADLRGKIVYLDFWATWCPSCRVALPWLDELQAGFPKDNFEIIAISVDKNPQKALDYVKREELKNLTILKDPSALSAKKYKLQSFPFSILLDKDGKIVKTFKGFQASHKQELIVALEKLL